jgi:hypothetical protein
MTDTDTCMGNGMTGAGREVVITGNVRPHQSDIPIQPRKEIILTSLTSPAGLGYILLVR